ncbi:TPA: DDE-type integrase/transposase/recombinase [Escherichia coli]|uniref:DDE-type integrase/transposase/recombinase n=2 Tax=Escherichia coli TaxID=562 RepID=UPI00106F46B6|nr:DDE-type integrase/transposase/recombinase [Escherichia coli]HAI1026289.1 transposase family protein [Escherichia coli]HAI1152525.1 transposase family protein [Escherichia coli]HAV8897000.1 transposase family protein [Escherichia coli]HBH9901911.1 DDE-type integrase/transposase/recombinase [Escherichia coli]HCT7168550.1 DDE-type integrase/transposase/recombinase [Escherichia coli]
MNPALTQRLVSIAAAADAAIHGEKEAVYRAACEELQMSRATLLKKLKGVRMSKPRKQRSDAGKTTLTHDEMLTISGAWLASPRPGNGKKGYSLEDIVDGLRDNGLIIAGRTDTETGEFFPLSIDAISRALRQHRMHPDQLRAPSPALELASLHPNHVWQLDASICVLYYLKNPAKKAKGDTGLRVMSAAEFNKNKPRNLDRIVNDRVWSFEITDHTTGWIYVEYRFGGESAVNFLEVMINAMQERGGADVLHGVPKILFTDPGSALVSASLLNMCRAMGICTIQHKAHNARATGSVEKARDIIERKFEGGLRFLRVDDIDELNRLARLWRMKFNRTAIHSRHCMSRTDAWLRITEEQLVKAPAPEICRELAISLPEERTVTGKLRVPFRGKEYDVSDVPGVFVGDKVMVARNPWSDEEARVVIINDEGFETFHVINAIQKDELWQYSTSAPVIGEEYRQLPETITRTNRDEVEQHTYGTASREETDAAKKDKALPFGGRFNPYLDIERDDHPAYLPKRGQASDVRGPRIEQRPMTHVEAAKALRDKFSADGLTWTPEHYRQLTAQYPDGVPEAALDEVMATLTTPARSSVISIVNGN